MATSSSKCRSEARGVYEAVGGPGEAWGSVTFSTTAGWVGCGS